MRDSGAADIIDAVLRTKSQDSAETSSTLHCVSVLLVSVQSK
jgi:hypothetical protein